MNAEIALPVEGKINEEHRLARSCAATAMQHAVRCGELLTAQKGLVERGEFGTWIAKNLQFSQATANNYMRAAKNPNALGNSIRHLYPSGRPQSKQERTVHILDAAEDRQPDEAPAGITTEQALKILEPIYSQRQIATRYRGWRNKVGQLRNTLRRAELELAEAEAALIRAALKHQGQP
jgi:hypothetical protein